jgi:ubiquinone/menaquinone biosynthesis C-methylase UbiE
LVWIKKNDLRKWLNRSGEEALRRIGIRRGHTVLDFGCGSGNYTIPVARIIGREGRIYALDNNKSALDELMQRAKSEGLENIRRMDTAGEVEIGLDTESVDVVLLYDIFWYFRLTDDRLPKLLSEVYRISRSDAMISVYPMHVDSERLKEKIENTGFRLTDKYVGTLFHDGNVERGHVLNFVKQAS